MKKAIRLGMAATLLLVVGCSSVQTTKEFHNEQLSLGQGQALAHIHSDVWGIYFLGFESMPVITGSYREPGDWRLFRHTVSPGRATEMVTAAAEEMGAEAVVDLDTDWSSEWQTFTLIFWLKEAQASGNAIDLTEGVGTGVAPTAEEAGAED